MLAGVGASWYQWLEQGRDISVSPQVLDSVGPGAAAEQRRAAASVCARRAQPARARGASGRRGHVRRAAAADRRVDAVSRRTSWTATATASCTTTRRAWCSACGPSNTPELSRRLLHRPHLPLAVEELGAERAARSSPSSVRPARRAPDDEGFQAVLGRGQGGQRRSSPSCGSGGTSRPPGRSARSSTIRWSGLLFVESTQLRVPARPDLSSCSTPRWTEADTAAQTASGWRRRRGDAGRCTPWRADLA